MAQAAQHETGNFFDQYWIVSLCLRDVLWIYLKKKNFILVIREFLFSCDFRIVKSWNRFVIHESRIVNSNPVLLLLLLTSRIKSMASSSSTIFSFTSIIIFQCSSMKLQLERYRTETHFLYKILSHWGLTSFQCDKKDLTGGKQALLFTFPVSCFI